MFDLEKILKPRPLTQWVLTAFGFFLGVVIFFIASEKIQAWLSGLAAPFCVMCAAVVWAMREKIDDVVNLEDLEPENFSQYKELVDLHRIRTLKYSFSTLMMALGAAMPTIALQVGITINFWMCTFAGASVGASIYNVLLANSWEEKFRERRNKTLYQSVLNKKKNEIEEEILATDNFKKQYESIVGHGWKDGGKI